MMATNPVASTIEAAINEWQRNSANRLSLAEIQLIVSHALDKPRTWIIAHGEQRFDENDYQAAEALILRAFAGEPLAYLTGSKEFWSLGFKVTEATLIPRPETELLIDILLEHGNTSAASLIDLGTGCGAIAIAMASERPQLDIFASDASAAALSVAKENAKRLLDRPIHLMQGSWLTMISNNCFDIIVSNPPYVAANDEHLKQLTYEPNAALIASGDGLSDISTIVNEAYRCLTSDGLLLIEHGYDQQTQVMALMQEAGYQQVKAFSDLAGQPRAVMARK